MKRFEVILGADIEVAFRGKISSYLEKLSLSLEDLTLEQANMIYRYSEEIDLVKL